MQAIASLSAASRGLQDTCQDVDEDRISQHSSSTICTSYDRQVVDMTANKVRVPQPPSTCAPKGFRRDVFKKGDHVAKAEALPEMASESHMGDKMFLAGPAGSALLQASRRKALVKATVPSSESPLDATVALQRPRSLRCRRMRSVATLQAAKVEATKGVSVASVAAPAPVKTEDAQSNAQLRVMADPVMDGAEYVPRRPVQSVVQARRAVAVAVAAHALIKSIWPTRK